MTGGAKDDKRINAAYATLDERADVQGILADKPHPFKSGKTALDYVIWCRTWAGRSGLVRCARLIERAIKVADSMPCEREETT